MSIDKAEAGDEMDGASARQTVRNQCRGESLDAGRRSNTAFRPNHCGW
jgi:hypothetical protein